MKSSVSNFVLLVLGVYLAPDSVYKGRWALCDSLQFKDYTPTCARNPCVNGGICEDLDYRLYACECPPGYEGTNCEIEIDGCASNPCVNGGYCVDLDGDYACECRNGFGGTDCEIYIDVCESNPCVNGGICIDLVGQFACQCPPGYEGANCEIDINECASNPCVNGGTCEDLDGRYLCTCPNGYKGTNCEIVIWRPEGCFVEKIRKRLLLSKRFEIVRKVNRKNPDIELIFGRCKAVAEKKGYEIFAIRRINRCVTSRNGTMISFSAYGPSRKCRTDGQGHGVGVIRRAMFVYTRNTQYLPSISGVISSITD